MPRMTVGVLLAGDVDGEAGAGVGGGGFEVGEIAAVFDAGSGEGGEAFLGVADAEDLKGVLGEGGGGGEKEVADLGGALVVAPVADPDDLGAGAVFAGARERDGVEDGGVGCLVQGPDAVHAEALAVDLAEHFAEDEDAVELVEAEGAEGLGRGAGAVVGVVEEEFVTEFGAELEQERGEGGRVPLVEDDDLLAGEEGEPGVAIEGVGWVGADGEVGVDLGELREGAGAAGLGAEVVDGPLVLGFEEVEGVAEFAERAEEAAKEVGVAVVPVGALGVGEIGEAEARRRHGVPGGGRGGRGGGGACCGGCCHC